MDESLVDLDKDWTSSDTELRLGLVLAELAGLEFLASHSSNQT
jgi:hypothetical protein